MKFVTKCSHCDKPVTPVAFEKVRPEVTHMECAMKSTAAVRKLVTAFNSK